MRGKYTKELLDPIVQSSVSMTEVLIKLGLRPSGGNHRNVSNKIRYFGLSKEHFTGQGWTKGQTKETNESIRKGSIKLTIPDDEVFIENSSYSSGGHLAKRVLQTGREYRCVLCGIDEWGGKRLALHLDHENGIGNDNRLENLRFLCPNCHQQTETWGIGNKKPMPVRKKDDLKCLHCSSPITRASKSGYCAKCVKRTEKMKEAQAKVRKSKCPPILELAAVIETGATWRSLAKQYGVSDSAVRKWSKKYGLI